MNDVFETGNGSLDALVADVVDQFMERFHRGEHPGIEEYAARHPEAAALLRQILPALQVLQPPAEEAAERPGDHTGTLGDFRILREVGRGGMGIVYEAEQISLGRRVALKVLPFAATLDPRQLQRFHNEARAAASLHHEHIVPVHAVGQERGVHFFAMQFIEGRTLADLIAQERRGTVSPDFDKSTAVPGVAPAAETRSVAGTTTAPPPRAAAYCRQVAAWGIQAADALEHAHSLGIVHRDIKPSNLMIDAQGQLWIADFGLARRAAESDLTITGDLLGTLRYMSPEQALAKHDLVDHRSDVYSLGATLYELLTLRPAADGKNRQEIIEKITHTDATSLRHHDRGIPADLETIVLKALAKEPESRYATAKEFAEDMRRHLNHEPIRARRPSLIQKLAKWARRNRPAVVAVGVIVVALTTATAVSAWQAEVARDAQHQAEKDRDRARTAQDDADAANRQATTEAAVARAVNSFLQEDLLGQVGEAPQYDMASNGDPNLTVREALDRASAKVAERFRDQPVVAAEIRTVIAKCYMALGERRLAAKHLEKAVELRKAYLGLDHPKTRHSIRRLAAEYTWIGRALDSIVILERMLESTRNTHGPDHPETFGLMAELALAYRRAGDWQRALPLMEQVVEKEQALRGKTAVVASNHAHELGMLYMDAGKYLEAAARQEKVFARRKAMLGPDREQTLFVMLTCARAYQRAGKLDEADRLLRDGLERGRKRGDSVGQITVAHTLEALSLNMLLQNRPVEAEPLAREALALYEKNHTTEGEWRLPYVVNLLGGTLLGQKKYAEAEPFLLQGYEGMKQNERTIIGQWRYRLTEAGERLIRYYEETNQPEKARAWREKLKPKPPDATSGQ
jgi:eukaryotic-like serine/threonine-protein kinase